MTDIAHTPASLAQTPNVIPFDSSRTRPGLRVMMLDARLRITQAVEAGQWIADEKITPHLFESLLPNSPALFKMTDLEATQAARDASILALFAIHAGIWQSPAQIGLLMELQSAAIRLQAHPSLCKDRSSEASGIAVATG